MRFSIFTSLAQVFFPIHCIGCGAPHEGLCPKCIARISYAPTLPQGQYAVFQYSHPLIQKGIRSLKYHRRKEAVASLAQYCAPYLMEYLASYIQSAHPTPIVLVPIPGDPKRTYERGFSPSACVAYMLQRLIPESSVAPVLEKYIHTTAQAKLPRAKRVRNLIGTMRCADLPSHSYTYVLIDDVITSGATMQEARRALKAAGAHHILAFALAHG